MNCLSGPLGELALPMAGRNRRISSNEQPNWQDGNFDMTRLAPGETFELPTLKGPGVITHIWMTSHAGGVNELNALSLRIYWDGDETPAVEAPLGDFFAVGHGRPATVESIPVQVSPTGSLTCYWRMPFRESARIVIRNDNMDRSTGLYWQVDWVEVHELPTETMHFHAQYRQEHPAAPGDYLIADIEGAGAYVGTVMSVTMAQDGWFGEGDDFFYIDGETVPSLQGTGSEDYFNDAWGFRPRCSAWFGQPRWEGWSAGDGGVCYRWHVLDPVRFSASLRFTIEHKGNCAESEDGFFIERPDFLSSVAFWYQAGPAKRFADLPGWPERRVPWQEIHLLTSLRSARATGSASPQVRTLGFFGGTPVLHWPNTEPGARLVTPIAVERAGRHAIRLTTWKAPGFGEYAVEIDGQRLPVTLDLNAAEPASVDLLLGVHTMDEGIHLLTFEAVGATSGPIALELLRLLCLPPETGRAVKNDNEAHFIRLGIGRALYAYRLAYGTLPASLEAMVELGIMEPRYLADENGHTLAQRPHDDRFEVVSEQGNWTHSWQGLDARR